MDAGGEKASGSVLGQRSNESKGTEVRGRSLRTVPGPWGTEAEETGWAGPERPRQNGRRSQAGGRAGHVGWASSPRQKPGLCTVRPDTRLTRRSLHGAGAWGFCSKREKKSDG